MKELLGGILAFALMSELIAVFCYGDWIRWVLVAAILLTCGLLNLVSDGSFSAKPSKQPQTTTSDEELERAEVEQVLRNLERASPAKSGGKGQS